MAHTTTPTPIPIPVRPSQADRRNAKPLQGSSTIIVTSATRVLTPGPVVISVLPAVSRTTVEEEASLVLAVELL